VIEGVVYNDANRNDTRDEGEPGLAGVQVWCDPCNGGSFGVKTDAQGGYRFRDLQPGLAQIEVIAPAGWQVISANPEDVRVSAGVTFTIDMALAPIVTPGPSPTPTATATSTATPTRTPTATPTRNPNWGTVRGQVYNDLNGDGLRQNGEYGVANMKIVATKDDGTRYECVSGADGAYDLGGLPSGVWNIRAATVAGWRQTDPAPDIAIFVADKMPFDLPLGLARVPAVYMPFILAGQ
jgi:hypothetical protein